MKRNIFFAFIPALFLCCHKNNIADSPYLNEPYDLVNQPEALAVYDASSYGIYKGVVISDDVKEASFKINIHNGFDYPYSLVYQNGAIEDSLICYLQSQNFPSVRDTTTIYPDQNISLGFSSFKTNTGLKIWFGTTADGSVSAAQAIFQKRLAGVALLKEKSNNQVFCFEGTFSGSDSGKIGFAIASGIASHIQLGNHGSGYSSTDSAHLINDSLYIGGYFDGHQVWGADYVGKIENDSFSGRCATLTNSNTPNYFSAKRTL